MGISLSLTGVLEELPGVPRNIGVAFDDLQDAGIFRDTSTATGAYARARRLVSQGFFKEARDLLYPHVRKAPESLRPHIGELLGVCAMSTGGDWRSLLEGALAGHSKQGQVSAAARTRCHIGDMDYLAGNLAAARVHYRQAQAAYRQLDATAKGAMVKRRRASVLLRSGRVHEALQSIDAALKAIIPSGKVRDEGLIRIERARILAHLGDPLTCAKELICAERMLASSGNGADRFRAKVARAETLVLLGETRRATAGLTRVLLDVIDLEDVRTRAQVHMLLGQAVLLSNPTKARRNLIRASHLFSTLKGAYGAAQCGIALARVEYMLGLNTRGRMAELQKAPLAHWPLLAACYAITKATQIADRAPDEARDILLHARRMLTQGGSRSLILGIDKNLQYLGLATQEELQAEALPKQAQFMKTGVMMTTPHAPLNNPQLIEEEHEVLFEHSASKAHALGLIHSGAKVKTTLPKPKRHGFKWGS